MVSSGPRWLLSADDAPLRDEVGGKGWGLFRLTRAGLPVPPWVAITVAASDLVLEALRPSIAKLVAGTGGEPRTAEQVSREIAELIGDAKWPPELSSILRGALEAQGLRGRFAVRSSAGDEDSSGRSYAGLLATRLFVTEKGLEAAIRACWASAYSGRALLYRHRMGLDPAAVRVAVVVQQMVNSRSSGVAFTADPRTGAPKHVIVAGYGLGEGVVGNRVETDAFSKDRQTRDARWQAQIVRKLRRIVPGDGGGVIEEEVPAQERDQPAVSGAQLERLFHLLERIEADAGEPQDVEWAIDEAGDLFILQARPISPAVSGHLAVWDDANIGESFPGVTSPLTFSVVRQTYESVFGAALQQIGMPARQVQVLQPHLRHLIGSVRGRIYNNLISYYHLFRAVPGLAASCEKWESAYGVSERFDLTQLAPVRAKGAWLERLAALRTMFWVGVRLATLRGSTRAFLEASAAVAERFTHVEASSADELFAAWSEIKSGHLRQWTILAFNDFLVFRGVDWVVRLVGQANVEAKKGLENLLLGEIRNIDSIEPLRSAERLAELVQATPVLAALFASDASANVVWSKLSASPEGWDFLARAEAHLRRNGHQTIQELKLESMTLEDCPWRLVTILRGLVTHPLDLEARPRPSAERALASLTRSQPLRGWLARRVLSLTRGAIARRERLARARGRAYAVLRKLFRALGAALARDHALEDADDVFFLTVEDIEAYLQVNLPENDLRGLVELRKRAYAELDRDGPPPHRFSCRGSIYRQRLVTSRGVSAGEHKELVGQPCASGKAHGIARVVLAPAIDERVDGEILIAPSTEPGWLFLLVGAKALVVERGSILSHSAIIGRELGIPTVVDVRDATRLIATGDELSVDGDTGEIQILRRAHETGATR